MKHYLVKWKNGDVSVVGARTNFELYDLLDTLGDAADPSTLIQKLPTTPFIIDCPVGEDPEFSDERHFANFRPGSDVFTKESLNVK